MIGLFRDQVGLPPKLLARIVRFDRLVFTGLTPTQVRPLLDDVYGLAG